MTATTIDAKELQVKLRALKTVNDPYLGAGPVANFEADSPLWPGERWSRIAPALSS